MTFLLVVLRKERALRGGHAAHSTAPPPQEPTDNQGTVPASACSGQTGSREDVDWERQRSGLTYSFLSEIKERGQGF